MPQAPMITATITRITITRTVTIMVTTITTTTMITIITTMVTGITPMLLTTNSAGPPARAMTDAEVAALYRLMTWLSPAFPVGGFSYSSGIEWAVEAGDINDAASLKDWLAAVLTDGSGF